MRRTTFNQIYHAIKPANGWEYALYHDKAHNKYELCYRTTPHFGTFWSLMLFDNLKDAYREYNEHVA